jgi:two-component system response regulator VanR
VRRRPLARRQARLGIDAYGAQWATYTASGPWSVATVVRSARGVAAFSSADRFRASGPTMPSIATSTVRVSDSGRLLHSPTVPLQGSVVLPARMRFSICRRYAPARSIESMRVLIVEDEPYMAEAIRDGLRLEAIAADIAGDGDTALELLSVNAYDIAVLDRDIPGPSGDEIAKRIVASGSGMPILMLTAADRLDDKASGFELGADDYLTKPFELRELVLRLRALDRRRAHNRPPVREIAGLRLDPFRREVYRDGRYVALTRKQFAVLEVLVAAEGGVVSAEELLERAWDENADPFTNAVRITVSALRKRLGEPWIIATVPGVGYRIDTRHPGHRGGGGTVDRAPG